jgi:hypothetical protein
VRFKCWLEGHETAPSDVGGERVARYPKLPPGNYRFHVIACNEDGVWNETGAAFLKSPCNRNSGRRLVSRRGDYFSARNCRRRCALHFHAKIAARIANCSSSRRRWKKNAPASRAICTTSSARTSRKWRCSAKWPRPTKIRPTKLNRTRSRFPRPRARRRVRSMKSSGPSIPPTTRSKASPITPANTRRNISRWPDCVTARICRRNCPRPDSAGSPPQRFSRVQGGRQQRRQARAGDRSLDSIAPAAGTFHFGNRRQRPRRRNQDSPQNRNGLRNMKKRMEDIRGEFSISKAPGGTGDAG